jgi:hypothetical protein
MKRKKTLRERLIVALGGAIKRKPRTKKPAPENKSLGAAPENKAL